MRLLYSLIWTVLLPVVLARLWWRGRREPGYRQHIGERFSFYPSIRASRIIWVHAVSAGETRAAEPLVRGLLENYPDASILLTHMTATGREAGAQLFGQNPRVTQAFLPYDLCLLVRRFLRHFRPQLCVLMETEVWPNLIASCQQEKVPVALVNARLSERSLRKAQRLSSLITPAAKAISVIAAQTSEDASRLQSLSGNAPAITGNIKFDVSVPQQQLNAGAAMRAQCGTRPVLLCASTRDGEEALILEAFLKKWPRGNTTQNAPLLLLVPRHPQRFDAVAEMLAQAGLQVLRRSALTTTEHTAALASADVLLGDSMGEMFMYYAMADLAFIGGSLLPFGGHNLIEPCAIGKPVLIGLHTFNFSDVTGQAIAAGAALRCADAGCMLESASELLSDPAGRQQMGSRALTFFHQHQGATARTLQVLKPYLS